MRSNTGTWSIEGYLVRKVKNQYTKKYTENLQ